MTNAVLHNFMMTEFDFNDVFFDNVFYYKKKNNPKNCGKIEVKI